MKTREEYIREAEAMLTRSQEISNYMNIPSNLQKELPMQNVQHQHFANYDHSLDINRLPALREKYNYVEPEASTKDLADITMNTEEYENIEPSEIPDLNGIFDDVFNPEGV